MEINLEMIAGRLELSEFVLDIHRVARTFRLDPLSHIERDVIILELIQTIFKSKLLQSGPHRIADWENGWSENLDDFRKSLSTRDLRPKYFAKSSIIRWDGDLYHAAADTENQLLAILIQTLTLGHFNEVDHIYEFGCGSGNNLVSMSEASPGKPLFGLDWATSSQEILKLLDGKNGSSIVGAQFDFFNPNYDFVLHPNSGVITVAALEQTGANYLKFMEYLLNQKPSIVIHIEPIAELLNAERLLDSLSADYFRARNYLAGFFDYLTSLSAAGSITIDQAIPSFIGSKFINGYSIVVWRPKY